jgi:hypothetical protein
MLAVRAAWWKVDIGSHEAARSLFQLALYCAARGGDPDVRARVLVDIAAHQVRTGDRAGALEILRFAQGDERISPEVQTLVAEVRKRATDYHLHIGASIPPRTGGEQLTLAEAMRRAHGHRYAVVYRLHSGKPVPIVADAGSDEIVFVATGRRIHRDAIAWYLVVSDMELWLAMLPR